MFQNAELAVGAITISSLRESAVSFTKPYRDLQMGILLGTPDSDNFDPWSFLTPLSNKLWMLTFVTAVVVGIIITIIDKLSPYGYYGKSTLTNLLRGCP